MDAIQIGPAHETFLVNVGLACNNAAAGWYTPEQALQHIRRAMDDVVAARRAAADFQRGQLAEQRHHLVDLDADSTCRDVPAWCRPHVEALRDAADTAFRNGQLQLASHFDLLADAEEAAA